jgi:hypothetical protein
MSVEPGLFVLHLTYYGVISGHILPGMALDNS